MGLRSAFPASMIALLIVHLGGMAGAATLSIRESGTGLASVAVAPATVVSFDIILDAPSPGIDQLQFDLDWDGGPTPVLGSVSDIQLGVFAGETSILFNQSAPGTPGKIRFIFNDTLPHAGSGIVIANVFATTIGNVGDGTSFTFSNEIAVLSGSPVPLSGQGATISVVPEPFSGILLGLGLLALAASRQRAPGA